MQMKSLSLLVLLLFHSWFNYNNPPTNFSSIIKSQTADYLSIRAEKIQDSTDITIYKSKCCLYSVKNAKIIVDKNDEKAVYYIENLSNGPDRDEIIKKIESCLKEEGSNWYYKTIKEDMTEDEHEVKKSHINKTLIQQYFSSKQDILIILCGNLNSNKLISLVITKNQDSTFNRINLEDKNFRTKYKILSL